MIAVSGPRLHRQLWLTLPLYAVALAIVGLDVWAVFFWRAVGGPMGIALSIAGAAVALVLTGLLSWDARKQWLLSRTSTRSLTSVPSGATTGRSGRARR